MHERAVAESVHLREGSFFEALVASLDVMMGLVGMYSFFIELRHVRVV